MESKNNYLDAEISIYPISPTNGWSEWKKRGKRDGSY